MHHEFVCKVSLSYHSADLDYIVTHVVSYSPEYFPSFTGILIHSDGILLKALVVNVESIAFH